MRRRLSIIALFLLAVFGLGSIGAPMVHMVMHATAITPWDDAELPVAFSHAEHPDADAERHAHPDITTRTCPLCALFATLVLGDVPFPSFAAYIAPALMPPAPSQRVAPFLQPISFPARAPPHAC